MEITFCGAAGGVTGSCMLMHVRDKRVLVDCGLFQGHDDDQGANMRFDFDPRSIDFVLLTHAHLDHCGRLPLLTERGFRGEIITTSATRDLARLVLLDAAQLQAEDAKREARRRRRRGMRGGAPLYDETDVFDAMDRFRHFAKYEKPNDLGDGLRVTYGNAGHILGSAWILLEVDEEDTQSVCCSRAISGRATRRSYGRAPQHPPPTSSSWRARMAIALTSRSSLPSPS